MTEPRYRVPEKLTPAHEVNDFHCGSPALDAWLHRYAWTNQQAGMATVFVSPVGSSVAGYYALATGAVSPADAPARVLRGVARHPVPVVLLTRLAVDERHSGRGLGRALLRDALLRTVRASEEVGVRALLVHSLDESARQFYLAQAEFLESPTDPLHLMLLMKDLRRAVRNN